MFEIVLDDGGMNLLSSAMLRSIRAQLPSSGSVLVLRSGRDHIFAAGADMAEMRAFGAAEAEEFARLGQELFAAIERLPMITVALIDGDCFGGALDLVLAFDLRFATPRARFAHPRARLGIVTGFGGTSRWRKAIDRAAARRLFLGNERLSAAAAIGDARRGDSLGDEGALPSCRRALATRIDVAGGATSGTLLTCASASTCRGATSARPRR